MRTTHPSTDTSIRAAHPADREVASRVLASAFRDDPVFSWCIPDPDRRAVLLPRFFELFVGAVLPYGESELASDGAAVALWVPAGRPAVPEDQAADFEATVIDLAGADMERIGAIMALLDEHHPTEPTRFLWFIG